MQPLRALGSPRWISGWPELVAEWHPTRNAGLEPYEVSHGSGRKVWWKCPRGPDHEWRTTANSRTSNRTGCPYCAGRKVSVTNSLAALRPDLARQWHPTRNGRLLPANVVARSTRPVWWSCPVAPDHQWRVSPHHRWSLEGGCPFCLGMRVCKSNSLATTRPRLAAEWHPRKNGGLTARAVVEGSSRCVWWRCTRNKRHEWRTAVCNRTQHGSRCPFCSGRRASPEHCLQVAYPAIAREWHPSRNGALTAASVTPRSSRLVWWRCLRGHEWRVRVRDRTRRCSGCPTCGGRSPAKPSLCAAPLGATCRATSVARELGKDHRRIEQVLVLAADPNIADGVPSGFIVDVMAHLEADRTVLQPALRRALRRPLTAREELHPRLAHLVSLCSAHPGQQGGHLRALYEAFREHSRFEEVVALPALESIMDGASMAALWEAIRQARATFSSSTTR